MSSFMPQGYEVPKSNNQYFNVSKLVNGTDNIIRILSKPIMGWIDWENKKPIRIPYTEKKPVAIDPLKPVKHFWSMVIWDYKDKLIKIMELTQASIQDVLYNLDCDEAWGEPTGYDINIKKSGENLETKYSVTPRPPKPVEQHILDAYKEVNPDLNALFSNGDPFQSEGNANSSKTVSEASEYFNTPEDSDYPKGEEDDEIKIENIPF